MQFTRTQQVTEHLKYFESDASLNLTSEYKKAAFFLSWNLNVFADPGVPATLCQRLLKAAAPTYFHLYLYAFSLHHTSVKQKHTHTSSLSVFFFYCFYSWKVEFRC